MPADIPGSAYKNLHLEPPGGSINLLNRAFDEHGDRVASTRKGWPRHAGHQFDQSVNQGDQNSAPELPMGCPKAMPPPEMLSFSSGMPRARWIHKHLGRESFIDFKQIDVIHGEVVPVQQRGHTGRRGGENCFGGDPGRAVAHDLGQWLHASPAAASVDATTRAAAIADLTGVASGDRALRIKGRTKFGEAFGRRKGLHAFVHPNSTFRSSELFGSPLPHP